MKSILLNNKLFTEDKLLQFSTLHSLCSTSTLLSFAPEPSPWHMLSPGRKILMWLLAVTPWREQGSRKRIRLVGEEISFLFLTFLPWFVTTHKSLNLPFSWFPIYLNHLCDFFPENLWSHESNQMTDASGSLASTPVCHSFTIQLHWKSPRFCPSGSLIQPRLLPSQPSFVTPPRLLFCRAHRVRTGPVLVPSIVKVWQE